MGYLLFTTLVWAFSFSLIGVYLAGQVDAWFSVLTRIVLATLVFLPFLRPAKVDWRTRLILMATGALQLGVMYGFYYHSFLYLSVPEVLLFTVMTPVFITLLNDAGERRFHPGFLLVALLAVLGAVAIRFDNLDGAYLTGLLLVQGANLSFAAGQVMYKRLMANSTLPHRTVFGWFFIGALVVAVASFALFGNMARLPATSQQWGILVYLGIAASGLGYFMWNKGATRVNVGTLAVMNNLLIPAGIVVNLAIWNQDADIPRLSVGAALILAALLISLRLDGVKTQAATAKAEQ